MKMKKLLAAALATVLSIATFTACAGDTPATTDAPKTDAPTTDAPTADAPATDAPAPSVSGKLTFSVWDLDVSDYLPAIVNAFKAEYPDVEVEIIDTPAADYSQKLGIDLNGGAAADVFLIKDADTSYSLNKKGQIEDLSAYVQRDGVDLSMFNGLADYFNFDGKQGGLPFRTDYYVLYYNKDIFDAAGEAYPSNDMTWAEFEELAKKLTSGSGADKKYGAHFHTWQALVENWAVQDGKNTIMGPDYSFMRSAYEMVLRMQNEDMTIQDFGTLKAGSIAYGSAFQSGNVAMLPMGSWFIPTMIQKKAAGETNVNWGVATIPHPEGTPAGYTVGSTTPIAINAASANKDAAWEFVKFVTTSDKGTNIIAEAGQIPGCVDADLLKVITSQPGMPEGIGAAMEVKNITLDRPYVEYVNEVNQMLGEEHGLVMLGEITVDQFIETINTRSKEIQG